MCYGKKLNLKMPRIRAYGEKSLIVYSKSEFFKFNFRFALIWFDDYKIFLKKFKNKFLILNIRILCFDSEIESWITRTLRKSVKILQIFNKRWGNSGFSGVCSNIDKIVPCKNRSWFYLFWDNENQSLTLSTWEIMQPAGCVYWKNFNPIHFYFSQRLPFYSIDRWKNQIKVLHWQ